MRPGTALELDPALMRTVLERALAHGGEFAELFVEEESSDSLLWDDGKLDRASAGRERGAGLRIIDGETTCFANGNDVSRDGLSSLAEQMAAEQSRPRTVSASSLELELLESTAPIELWPDDVPVARKVAVLALADRIARDTDPRVVQVTATLQTRRRRIVVVNSAGAALGEESPLVTLVCQVVARAEGDIRSGHQHTSAALGWEFLTPREIENVAGNAARAACLQLDASPAPSGTMPVILSSKAGGTMIHEACGHGLEADFYLKQLSIYSGKLGQKVASEKITVVDDGTLPGRRGSNRIDDEGCPTGRIVLIERGVLVGLLHSRETARKLNMAPTGNGRRESYRHLPIPRMRNTFICPGDDDPAAILASVEDGLFVAQMGGGEVDIVSGNFVFHCLEAYRIRQGELAEPVRDATLTGNGPAVLASIDRVGRDLGWAVGTCGKDGQGVPVADAQPTIRIPALVVGGGAPKDAPGPVQRGGR